MRGFLKYIFSNLSTTNWLILANIIISVFVWILVAAFPNLHLIESLAFSWDNLASGKIWTLITSMFIHANFWHLAFNMFSLFFIGRFLENIIGGKRFLAFYLISGIAACLVAGVLSLIPYSRIFATPASLGVGASGAIFGLAGLLAVLIPKGKVYLIAGPLIALILEFALQPLLPANVMYVLGFIVTIYIMISILAIFSFNPRLRKLAVPIEMPFWMLPVIAIVPLVIIGLFVDLPIGNTAHFGGLIAGLIYGAYLRRKYKRKVKILNTFVARQSR
jgi:membrane associated rhomboid family serine protease